MSDRRGNLAQVNMAGIYLGKNADFGVVDFCRGLHYPQWMANTESPSTTKTRSTIWTSPQYTSHQHMYEGYPPSSVLPNMLGKRKYGSPDSTSCHGESFIPNNLHGWGHTSRHPELTPFKRRAVDKEDSRHPALVPNLPQIPLNDGEPRSNISLQSKDDKKIKAQDQHQLQLARMEESTNEKKNKNPTKVSTSSPKIHKKSSQTKPMTPKTKQEEHWMSMLSDLKEFKAKHGNCVVPRFYFDNQKLASWVGDQRKQYRLLQLGRPTSMTKRRIALLKEMDFEWNAQDAAWKNSYEDLKQFHADHGHCMVPMNFAKYPKLGVWVLNQRRQYKKLIRGQNSHMNDERIHKLKSINFIWDYHDECWENRLMSFVSTTKLLVTAMFQPPLHHITHSVSGYTSRGYSIDCSRRGNSRA